MGLKATFASRLMTALYWSEMNMTQLSDRTGITAASLSRYVNGQRHARADKLVAISKALNVSVDYLLGLTDDMGVDKKF